MVLITLLSALEIFPDFGPMRKAEQRPHHRQAAA